MTSTSCYVTPESDIEAAVVRRDEVVVVGDRVRHVGQHFASAAHGTATVIGFRRGREGMPEGWMTIIVAPDRPHGYGNRWDHDRVIKCTIAGEDVAA